MKKYEERDVFISENGDVETKPHYAWTQNILTDEERAIADVSNRHFGGARIVVSFPLHEPQTAEVPVDIIPI